MKGENKKGACNFCHLSALKYILYCFPLMRISVTHHHRATVSNTFGCSTGTCLSWQSATLGIRLFNEKVQIIMSLLTTEIAALSANFLPRRALLVG